MRRARQVRLITFLTLFSIAFIGSLIGQRAVLVLFLCTAALAVAYLIFWPYLYGLHARARGRRGFEVIVKESPRN